MMKEKRTAFPTVLAVLFLSLCGLALRFFERGGASAIPLIAVSALAVVCFLPAALRLAKDGMFAQVFHPRKADFALCAISAVLLLAAGGMTLSAGSGARAYLTAAGVAVTAMALLAAVNDRRRSAPPKPIYYVVPILFYVVKLLLVFPKKWMVDPAILDYCFALFALLSFMLGSYHAAALSFDKGSRRWLAFFSMTGVFFGCVSLPGMELSELLVYTSGAVWMLACLLQCFTRPDAS